VTFTQPGANIKKTADGVEEEEEDVDDDDDEKARHSSSVSNDILSKDPKGGELRGRGG